MRGVSLGASVGIVAVRAYQAVLSPLFRGACRFQPSCSQYAIEALSEHGLLRGVWLALRRLARCHPLGAAGFDPVPPAQHDR
jgi:putative membrane protein insertion efficiency factor